MTASRASRPTVMYYCQHSVGLGHFVRSLAIAEALSERFRVVMVSGGANPQESLVPSGVELVDLPAIAAADGRGSRLVSVDPRRELEDVWRAREHTLLQLLGRLRPSALVVELFPFGRRKFERELVPLLEAASAMDPAPAIISSVRDILVDGKVNQEERDDLAARRLNEYFDAVIVHADPTFATLEETFRPSIPVEPPVFYSGFVVRSARRPEIERPGQPRVLVSAGGGKIGAALVRTAAVAHRRYLAPRGVHTRIVTGPFLAPEVVEELEAHAEDCASLTVSRFEPRLCEAMASSSISVSQCGYNTALDIVRAGVPALVVPYDLDGETEQALRASRLAQRGVVRQLAMDALTAESLSAAIFQTLTMSPRRASFDLGGKAATARIVADLVEGRVARRSSGGAPRRDSDRVLG